MQLESLLLALMLTHVPPGKTQFSVQPAEQSEATTWSDFYGSWVERETPAHAEKRYASIAAAFRAEAEALLCRTFDGKDIDDCEPHPEAVDGSGAPRWTPLDLSLLSLAVAIQESGLREDVQVGRGSAKKPSQDGGRGRGPGGEACLMQIHPTISWRVADVDEELRRKAKGGDRQAREAILKTLVGRDSQALRHCIRAGMRTLIRGRAHCAWAKPRQAWDIAAVSIFATGIGCDPDSSGKVMRRVLLYRKLRVQAASLRRAPPEPKEQAPGSGESAVYFPHFAPRARILRAAA